MTLHALSDRAITDLVGELVGGPPSPELLAALRRVGGNPRLICEFIAGLREEQLLATSKGQVTVTAERVPKRLHGVVLSQLGRLGQPTRQLLEVAAVLGQSFAVADVAEMLGQPPVSVLPALNEALATEIIQADGEMLSFRDSLTWSAVVGTVPQAVARALHLQFAEILLARGATLSAAEHLISGVRRGDRRELDMLTRAAAELMHASPEVAANLALRSLELTADQDSAWRERSVITARALVAARRLDEAIRVIDAALSRPATIAEQAELRCRLALSYLLQGKLEQAATEARWVLGRQDVPEGAREEASVLLMRVLAGMPGQRQAEARARGVLAARQQSSGREVTAAVGLLARVRWRDGQLAEGLRLYRDAVSSVSPDGGTWLNLMGAQLDLASSLIDIRQLDEANALIDALVKDLGQASTAESQARPLLLRSRVRLIEGRLDEATDAAHAVLDRNPGWKAGDDSSRDYWDALAKCQLATIAFRRGDLHKAEKLLAQLPSDPRNPRADSLSAWLSLAAAFVADAREIPGKAVVSLAWAYDGIGEFKWLLVAEPVLAPWLVRLALATGDSRRAADGNRGDAVRFFDMAHEGYSGMGAARDVARVRQLRALGMTRRRAVNRDRPAGAWGRLTETEAGIAELVAHGLTNRQIAEQSFVSVNTVAFHLRQIFRKLGVASRVELATLVLKARQDAN